MIYLLVAQVVNPYMSLMFDGYEKLFETWQNITIYYCFYLLYSVRDLF